MATRSSETAGAGLPTAARFRMPGLVLTGIILLAVAARLYLIFSTRATEEDFYITLRYAENLAHGLGLVYNPGEHVLGTTTPLYTLLLALIVRVGLDPVLCGKLFAVGADALSCWFIVRFARKIERPLAGLCAATCFAILPLNLTESVKGMESSLVACAGIGAWCLLAERRQRAAWLCAALLTLLRIDGAMLAVILLLTCLWRDRKLPWQGLSVYAAVTLPWMLYATVAFGSPIPTSLRAKLIVYAWHNSQAFPNLLPFLKLMTHNSAGAVLFAGAVLEVSRAAWRSKAFISRKGAKAQRDADSAHAEGELSPVSRAEAQGGAEQPSIPKALVCGEHLPLVAMMAWMLLYYAGMAFSKVFLFGWYFLPPTPEYYLIAFVGLGRLTALLPANLRAQVAAQPAGLAATVLAVGAVMCAVTVPRVAVSLSESQRVEDELRIPIGLRLKELARPGDTVMLEPIGYIGYYSGLRVLDTVGLVSPEVLPFYRNEEPSPYHAIWRKFRPEWVLLRAGELNDLRRYESTLPPSERLEAQYGWVKGWGGTHNAPDSRAPFSLFRRTTMGATPHAL